jgi:ATP-dependent Clp protease protease subunit
MATSSKRNSSKQSRIIQLGEIDNENACIVVEAIYEINEEDKKKEEDKREPIKLILMSPGGNVYDGMGIIDVIEQSITPIHIYVHGHAQSMGFAIATCGHYRYASKRTTFMYHELSWETDREKLQYHEQEVKEGKRLWQIYDDIITTNTDIPLKTLSQVKKQHKEWYMTAQEALEWGVIDEII